MAEFDEGTLWSYLDEIIGQLKEIIRRLEDVEKAVKRI